MGFLMNSSSSVRSCSCVALCRFWFFCCWVRVLLRGGRRDIGAPAVAETVGEGVDDDIFEEEVAGDSFAGSNVHSDL